MKKISLFAAACALVVTACGPDSSAQLNAPMPGDTLGESQDELHSSAKTWFPLDEGNQWVFRAGQTEHVIRSEYAYDHLRYVTGLTPEPAWFGFSSTYTTNLYVWNDEAQGWSYHTRFGYRYTPWTVKTTQGPCDTFKARRVRTDVTVTTPAGTFKNAREVEFDLVPDPAAFCAPRGIKSITYAPGVGPIEIVKAVGYRYEKFALVSAKVGTKSYPDAQQQGALKLSADKASYVNVPNTRFCITIAPCPSNEVTATAKFTLVLTNTTSSKQTFEFGTGQQFDFELVDAGGKTVKAWSDDQGFTLALTQFTLLPGQSRTFVGEVELKDRDGYQLSGTYTVRGKVTTFSAVPLPTTAETQISVSIQE